MSAKDRVYEKLAKIIQDKDKKSGVTASELENCMDIKRSAISHYLNLLFLEGKISKTTERPVQYYISKSCDKDKCTSNKKDIFSTFIGANGSLRAQIEQCKSAVIYPPKGLPVILNGNSGVGKSYMASLIYQYAVDRGVISKNAPFVELNCADYANNAELLSSILFGYVEGAFTGAQKDKKGLIDEADGGYLFLDEIHRLSYENQEKLFLYLDKGKFRRLGENDTWHSATVRLVMATTEDANKVLLETFYRRIPIRITIPDFQQRPLLERMKLIESFYWQESKILERSFEVKADVLDTLAYMVSKGNIGMLQNYIKLSCANAYKNQMDKNCIVITRNDLPQDLLVSQEIKFSKLNNSSFFVEGDDPTYFNMNKKLISEVDEDVEKYISNIKETIDKNLLKNIKLLIEKMKRIMKNIYGIDFNSIKANKYLDPIIIYTYCKLDTELKMLSERYGIIFSDNIKNSLFTVLMYSVHRTDEYITETKFANHIKRIKRYNSKAFSLSCKLIEKFGELSHGEYDILHLLIPIIILDAMHIDTKIQAIIVAHGNSTASSIASVANTLCEAFIFEPFDMPIKDDSMCVINKVNNYIDGIDTSNGLILLVDMGSLQQMYEPIKNHLEGDLLIINNITTSMAIDIGFKIKNNEPFGDIIEKSKNAYKTELRYYEGIAPGDNIIISCISGIGVAKKIKKIFENRLDTNKIEIITLEYSKLKKIVQIDKSSLLKRTRLVITTNYLDTSPIPSINLKDVISNSGQLILTNVLNDIIVEDDFKQLCDDLTKFFSIEGIKNNLSFLNPNVVANQVEYIIKQYEDYYDIYFENYVRLNLYMHISVMIERLMIGEGVSTEELGNLTDIQQEFVDITKNAFYSVEQKYHINLPMSEIILLYEIIRNHIYEK